MLAGGLATRMRPRTLTVPKAMLEVAGRPFVDWQLERLAACGVRRRRHVRRAPRRADRGARGRRRALRRARSLGRTRGRSSSARRGAIRAALDAARARRSSSPTATATCPSTTPSRCASWSATPTATASWRSTRTTAPWDASNVVMARRRRGSLRYEKGAPGRRAFDHIDYGATALRREVIAALPGGADRAASTRSSAISRRGSACGRAWPVRGFSRSARRKGWPSSNRHLRTRAAS